MPKEIFCEFLGNIISLLSAYVILCTMLSNYVYKIGTNVYTNAHIANTSPTIKNGRQFRAPVLCISDIIPLSGQQ